MPPANVLAQLSDASPRPAGEGYVAERHRSYPGIILVWAPCDCVFISDSKESFVTPCRTEACEFDWENVKVALAALESAEAAVRAGGGNKDGSDILPAGGNAGATGDSPQGGGGLAEPPAGTAEEAADMISEGGPVQFGDD